MIDQIINNLPDDLRAKMPLPDGFENLPQDVRDQLKHVYMNKSLNWDEKREQVTAIIDNLPEEVRYFIRSNLQSSYSHIFGNITRIFNNFLLTNFP